MNKNVKSIFFVLTLVTLLLAIGTVSAVDNTNSTSIASDTNAVTTITDTSSDSVITEQVETSNDNNVDTKNMKKDDKKVKTSSKNVDASNFDELVTAVSNAVNDNENDEYIIELTGSEYVIDNNVANQIGGTSSINKTIIINANNQVLSSMSRNLVVRSGSNITINNLTITSRITQQGNLTLNNVNCINMIYNYANLTITKSIMDCTIMNNAKLTIDEDTVFGNQTRITGDGDVISDDMNRLLPYLQTYNGNYTFENVTVNSYKQNNGNITYINSYLSSASIYNQGNITLINCRIKNMLNNYGSITIDDNCVFETGHMLMGNGIIIINDSNRIYPYTNTFNGEHIFSNITLNKTITNNGNLTINNCILNSTITNNANLTISDDTVFEEGFAISGTGAVIINDSNRIIPYLSTYAGDYTVENITIATQKTNNGNLTLTNSTITNRINNNGNITLTNSLLNNTISNNGLLIVDDNTIIGENALINGNGIVIINDSNRIYPYTSTFNGEHTLSNITLNKTITNNGNLTINNCILNSTITNNGKLVISDDTVLDVNFNPSGNGEIVINDTDKLIPYLNTYDGNYTLENLTITNKKSNTGNLTIINCNITTTITNRGNITVINSYYDSGEAFSNYGNITFVNTTLITNYNYNYRNGVMNFTNKSLVSVRYYFGNNGGTLIFSDDIQWGEYLALTGYEDGTIIMNNSSPLTLLVGDYYEFKGNHTFINATIDKSFTYEGDILFINSTLNGYVQNQNNITFEKSIINTTISNSGNITFDDETIFTENTKITGRGNIFINDITRILPYINRIDGNYTINNFVFNKKMTFYGNIICNNCTFNENMINYANLTLNNATVNKNITNNGNLTINNITINESSRINGNGKVYIQDMQAIFNNLNTYDGDYTIENINITDIKTNNGNLTLNNITLNNHLINNGKLILNQSIQNSNITNSNDLTIENTIINANITNRNTTKISNSTLNGTIVNEGQITINDDNILGENFVITGNGEIISNNITKLIPYMQTYNGNYTIENSTLTNKKTNNGNVTLINCQITEGITNYANLTLINCSFSNNIILNNASVNVILIKNQGNMTIIGLVMHNNTFNSTYVNNRPTPIPNGIYNEGTMTITNSTFFNNTNEYYYYNNEIMGYDNGGRGGCINNNGTLTIDNCNFTDNYAGMYGGAIFGPCNVSNSIFQRNIAGYSGGAINGGGTITNCTFDANGVEVIGVNSGIGSVIFGSGAVALANNATVTDSTFINNYAMSGSLTGSDGQALVGVTLSGGAISLSNNDVINNCTFINNTCDHGSAIDNGIFSFSYINLNNNTVTNCLFKENSGNTNEAKSAIINVGGSSSIHLINNTFQDNYNASYLIYNEVGYNTTFYYNDFFTTHIYNETIDNNKFIDNDMQIGTLFSLEPDRIIKTDNIYTNTTINDNLTLDIPNRIYAGEPITITGTYTINNPQDYDEFILEQNKFNIYINGVLNQTVDKPEFTITPTSGTMMITVQPTISQTRKTTAIRSTTLTNITITPENYNEYIYEGVLIGISKDSKVRFNGQFTDKEDILIDTSDIIIEGTNATFTNTVFVLEAENIIIQNMNINNNNTAAPISNYKNNNIIANNTIILNKENGKTNAIYNTANNTLIANNTLNVQAPAGDIDFSTGSGVAGTQAILLIGGNNNTIQNNTININATSTSFYGTLEAITNSNEATNTLITQNNITISGANFNYAIDSLNNVENITITENTITVTGERYCDGIQVGNNAHNIIIDNNNITCICINTTELDTEGAITYGVIGTSMGGDITTNMTITNNNIYLTGTANYGIELYAVDTTEIHNNTITVNGPYSLGIGYAYSPNGNATGNNITINGDSTTPINHITEEFKPENVGIRIQNGTNNVSITDNTITTSDIGGQDTTIHTDPDNVTIANNKLISSQGYGSESIIAPTNTIVENNTIETTTTIEVPEKVLTNTPVTLTATVTDEFENPINTGTITFTIGDEIIATAQVTDGTATTTATFTQVQDSTITATYTPTSTGLSASNAEASISIQKPITQLNIEDITLTAGETVTLTATVTDQLQNNINGGKVVFKVNGKTVKDANGKVVYAKVVDGIAAAEYTVHESLSGKEINITATYSGTSTYNKETTTITTTVATPQATLTVTPITEDIQAGSTITLKAKVAVGNNAITAGKIVFKINGKTVKDENGKVIYAKVDLNGEVSVDYVLPASYKVGNYTIEAVFTGVGYDKLTSNTTMNIVKA